MGACQIATQACHLRPEGAQRHGGRQLTTTLGQDRKHQRINHLVSRALWVFTSGRTYLQQAHGKRGQQTQQAYQAVNTLQLPLLDATPAFETWVIVLDQPSMPIPVHALPRLFERGGRDRGQQDPFQRLLSFWSRLFPDTNDPNRQGLLARSRLMARWQERHLTKGKLEPGRTPLMTMPSWNLERTARLARPGPCAHQRIRDLFFALLDAPILGRSDQKLRLRRLTRLKEREHISTPISDMHPDASRLRRPNGMHLAYPDIGFALFALAPLIPLLPIGSRNAHKGFLGQAPEDFSCLRTHRKHRLHEKSPSSFVADLSHSADLATMGKIDVGRILYQQNHRRASSLLSGLFKVRLHQGSKGDIWLIQQTIQRFGLFPGVHLSWQRTQGVLRQVGGRFDRSSRATHIVQLDTPKGLLGPAFGVQQFLCVHPLFYHFVKCG